MAHYDTWGLCSKHKGVRERWQHSADPCKYDGGNVRAVQECHVQSASAARLLARGASRQVTEEGRPELCLCAYFCGARGCSGGIQLQRNPASHERKPTQGRGVLSAGNQYSTGLHGIFRTAFGNGDQPDARKHIEAVAV